MHGTTVKENCENIKIYVEMFLVLLVHEASVAMD